MSDTRDTDEATDALGGVTMLAIPEEHIDKVREYLATLQQEEAEVAGYATIPVTIKTPAGGTGCRRTGGTTSVDVSCSDHMA